jgi:adenylosuccinate lyase
LYIQDLLQDLEYVEYLETQVKARGAKGTVGTQATFLELFEGDHGKVRALDELVSEKLGFNEVFPVTGQTYPRKLDMKTAETLAGVGMSAHKFAVDMRLLSNLKVQEEPFAKQQVGSSAMAYKRNPMRSERMTGLARKLMGLPANFAATAGNQWFERTLDDSAIRRMDMAQAFLLTDAILKLYVNITSDMVVYPKQVERYLRTELPFMATEKILMACVERGKSRQDMHEVIREHSVAAGLAVKEEGKENDLLDRLGDDDRIPFAHAELNDLIGNYQEFTGRASEQTSEYLTEVVSDVLARYSDLGTVDSSLMV